MSDRILSLMTLISALGCGLIAGVFFAFSSFVMPALARLPAAHGIAAMQSINVVVINRVFLGAMFGTAALCLLLAAGSLASGTQHGLALRLAGCALYLLGTIVVTIAFNVPLNDALSRVTADAAEGAQLWPRHVSTWTAWNHVRTAAALAAAALLTLAYRSP